MTEVDINLKNAESFVDELEEIEEEVAMNVAYEVWTNVDYASYQEFGTSEQSGTPHLRPGFAEAMRRFNDIVDTAQTTAQALELVAIQVTVNTQRKAPVDTGNLRNSYDWRRLDG